MQALRAEGVPCSPGYTSLTGSEAMSCGLKEVSAREGPHPCSISEHVAQHEACYLSQNLLLGTREDMDSIAEATSKVQRTRG